MKAVSIRLENVSKTFLHRIKGEVSAVDQVSLQVDPGEFLTLLGPSGCGKTTTLRMVAGFERPGRGRVFIGDEDVTDLMANQRNIGDLCSRTMPCSHTFPSLKMWLMA